MFPLDGPQNHPQPYPRLGVTETGFAIQKVSNQVEILNCS